MTVGKTSNDAGASSPSDLGPQTSARLIEPRKLRS